MIRERPARAHRGRALAWLDDWRDARREQPFFLWVHFFDPHQPYDVQVGRPGGAHADGLRRRDRRGRPRRRPAAVDWLEQHGALDDTVVIVTADHGESLGEHGEPTHGIFIYDATVRVPLIWRYPRALPRGHDVRRPGAAHRHRPDDARRSSGCRAARRRRASTSRRRCRGETPPPDLRPVLGGAARRGGLRHGAASGVRQAGGSTSRRRVRSCTTCAPIPRELDNRIPTIRRRRRRSSSARAVVARQRGAGAGRADARDRPRDRGHAACARLLAPPEQRAEMAGMDPKDGIALYAKLQEARQLAQASSGTRLETLLRRCSPRRPENVTARNVLALARGAPRRSRRGRAPVLASLAQPAAPASRAAGRSAPSRSGATTSTTPSGGSRRRSRSRRRSSRR